MARLTQATKLDRFQAEFETMAADERRVTLAQLDAVDRLLQRQEAARIPVVVTEIGADGAPLHLELQEAK